jgi:hypothetical protein
MTTSYKTKCRSKHPESCPYHGASERIKSEPAIQNSSDNWKTGYENAMSSMLVSEGYILDPSRGSTWGRSFDRELTKHLKECGASDVRDIKDASWYEFQDTFTGSKEEYGVQAHITCNCGKVKGATLEVQGSFGDIMNKVLRF